MEDKVMRTKDRVREYADKHPTATVREIQTALGLSSPSVVQFHLKVDSKDNIIEAKDKRIAELEAALPQWQPIETAPKDNTPILVPTNAHSDGIVIVRWYTYNGLAAWRDWDEDVHFPTHWMPLPQPPGE